LAGFFPLLLSLLGLAALVGWWHIMRQRQRALELLTSDEPLTASTPTIAEPRSFTRRHRILPWLVGVTAALALWFAVALRSEFAVAFGLIVGLLGSQVEAWWHNTQIARIEAQLGDAIDIMIGSLGAGASVLNALDSAAAEARPPLRAQLDEVVGRIRLGDEPQAVFQALVRRVPLETFQLFASTLAVHWEVGGSLAPTLATVGKVIRDRIELSRRVRSLTAQARASVVAILLATYFIALIIWRNDPPRMETFLSTSIGASLAAGAVVLQAIGIVWSSLMSRIRF
jgi:Flp pilus assembly protein TadB